MILEKTPYSVVIRTMHAEHEKLLYFVEKESNKILNMRYHDKDVYHSIYTHQVSKNTYMFWGGRIVTPVRFKNIGRHNYRAGFCLVVNTSNGERTIYCLGKKNLGNGKKIDALIIYTSHFFRRYRERSGYPESMSTNELISHFLVRNSEFIPRDYKVMSRKDHKNGTAIQVNDGMCFGTEEFHNEDGYEFYVLKNNTFVPESMLKNEQTDGIMTDEKYHEIFARGTRDFVLNHPILSKYSK